MPDKPTWRTFIIAWLLILAGSLLAHQIQTAGDIEIKDVRFTGANGNTLSALLYIPDNASAQTPAPGILAVHGYINSREVQSGFAIEFARRGYVVLALDQAGHGYSDGPAFANGFGGPAALDYLRRLDIVDNDNIGLEGHSMGGWTVLAAAAATPDGYRSMVLQGSSTGSGMAMPGTPDWPRNVAVVFAQYDEFAPLMWEVAEGADAGTSAKLQALFGTSSTVIEGQVYGSIDQGNARVWHAPPVTHPGNHISHTSIGHAIDWFGQTLEGGTPGAVDDQIWFFKEVGTLIGLLGFVMLILGSFNILLLTPYFDRLRSPDAPSAYVRRTGKWWVAATISAIIPVATFYPAMGWGAALLPATAWLPQTISSQIAVWAIVNGVIFTILGFIIRTGKLTYSHQLLPSISIALLTVGMAYLSVLAADFLFKVDFRFWFVGVKAMNLNQLQIMLVYLIPFTLFFVLALRALHSGLSVASDRPLTQYSSNALALMGGFLLFLIAQYTSLFTRGVLLTPAEPLNTIVMMQFVPMLLIVAIISTYTYRRTASYLPGAFINALFVSWYIVAGQATQFAG
ncbi:MAG: alpha/beta hydrolase [Gammaproteobacteria bacterium]|nr:alpha/beta hydrolase [Gammaproteobacteria bacterium]|tara:strand:+ start:4205 stop:5911 length:1707 start_codon:yes stop_codon:yes gene_type:complete